MEALGKHKKQIVVEILWVSHGVWVVVSTLTDLP